MYSGPCILRPHIQPEKYGLKMKVILKWKDIYIENMSAVIDDLKMKIPKWRESLTEVVLKCRHHCIGNVGMLTGGFLLYPCQL